MKRQQWLGVLVLTALLGHFLLLGKVTSIAVETGLVDTYRLNMLTLAAWG